MASIHGQNAPLPFVRSVEVSQTFVIKSLMLFYGGFAYSSCFSFLEVSLISFFFAL